jgi:tetratricopeptide (TPR) repeat protein
MNRYFISLILLLFGCTNFKKNKKKDYRQALIEIEEGNNHKAILILEEFLKVNFDPQAAAIQASLLFEEKNYSEGVKILKKALKNTKNSNLRYDILNNLACGLMILDRQQEAIDIWLQISQEKLYATPELAYFNLGFHEFRSQNYQKASQYFTKCLTIQPQYYDARWYLILSYLYLKNHEEASQQLAILMRQLPDNPSVLNLQNQITNLCQ